MIDAWQAAGITLAILLSFAVIWGTIMTLQLHTDIFDNDASNDNIDNQDITDEVISFTVLGFHLLSAWNDPSLPAENKWAVRKDPIVQMISDQEADVVLFNDVAKSVQTDWVDASFGGAFQITQEAGETGVDLQANPVMTRKDLNFKKKLACDVIFFTTTASTPQQRMYSYQKWQTQNNFVVVFISTQLCERSGQIVQQQQMVGQLADFINQQKDNIVIVSGNFNIGQEGDDETYNAADDLASQTGLIRDYTKQSGSSGTTNPNTLIYQSLDNGRLNAGVASDQILFTRSKYLTPVYSTVVRTLRTPLNSSEQMYCLSDHEPILTTFMLGDLKTPENKSKVC